MAHIFFERLEYRRSTQTFLDLPTMIQPLYGIGPAFPVSSTPGYSTSQWGTTLPSIPGSIYDPSSWSNPISSPQGISYGPSGMPFNPRTSIALTRPMIGTSQFGSDPYSMWGQIGQWAGGQNYGSGMPGTGFSPVGAAYVKFPALGSTGNLASGISSPVGAAYVKFPALGSAGNLPSGGNSPVGAAYVKFPALGSARNLTSGITSPVGSGYIKYPNPGR
jgi:hypothetical protein